MIPNPEMIPIFLLVDPEMIPKELTGGMVMKHGTVDCSIIRESKEIFAYVVNRFAEPILTTKRE